MIRRIARRCLAVYCLLVYCLLPSLLLAAEPIEKFDIPGGTVTSEAGRVNMVRLESGGEAVQIYRGDRGGRLLLTDGRRDLIADTLEQFDDGSKTASRPTIAAPAKATYWLKQPHDFWAGFVKGRFHDYAQQTTKAPATALPVEQWVKNGDRIGVGDLELRVLETPGYTRSAVSYLIKADGKTVAFTGDLIYGDGQVLDLYSFQDAIADAQVRGYHGYGARLADLVASLDKLADESPDVIVPARGAPLAQPQKAIQRLKSRAPLYERLLAEISSGAYEGKA